MAKTLYKQKQADQTQISSDFMLIFMLKYFLPFLSNFYKIFNFHTNSTFQNFNTILYFLITISGISKVVDYMKKI